MAWEQAKINGTIYMVPNYANEFGQDVMAVRGDLMEQYGVEQITSWDEMKEFAMAAAADGMYTFQYGPWYQYFPDRGPVHPGRRSQIRRAGAVQRPGSGGSGPVLHP